MVAVSPERTQRTNEQWLSELCASGPAAEAALADLRALVAGAVRRAVGAAGTADEATLEDLTQVGQVHVLRQLGRFEGRSRFTTWAWAVAVRAALSELRRAAYRASAEPLPAESATPASAAPTPPESAERGEIVALMQGVIARELTERQRTALVAELDGTPREVLLARLGINANALHKLLHDARRKLLLGLRAAGIHDDEVREAFDL